MVGELVTRAGWQCPGCKAFYSPDVPGCACESSGAGLPSPVAVPFPLPVTPTLTFQLDGPGDQFIRWLRHEVRRRGGPGQVFA